MSGFSITASQGEVAINSGAGGDVTISCKHPDSNGGALVIQVDGSGITVPSGSQSITCTATSSSTGPSVTGTLPQCTAIGGGLTIKIIGDSTVVISATNCSSPGSIVITGSGSVTASDPDLVGREIEVPADPSRESPFRR